MGRGGAFFNVAHMHKHASVKIDIPNHLVDC